MKTPEAPNLPPLGKRTLSFDGDPSGQSTFCRRAIPPLREPNLHSSNPYCTAVFCTVPRNQIFSPGISAAALPPDSTFSCPSSSHRRSPILHSALSTLHSPNPYGTALFCSVPRNRIFSLFDISSSCSFVPFVCFVVPSFGPTTTSFPT